MAKTNAKTKAAKRSRGPRMSAEERRELVADIALLADRTRLLGQLQAYAACDDATVRDAVRRRWGQLYDFVGRESGVQGEELRRFFATGMLLTVAAAMDLFAVDGAWSERLMPAKG